MSMYKINSQNFQLVGNQPPFSMQISIQEPIFVMFKLQGCVGCAAIEPVFSQLANEDRRVSYGVVDLTQNKEVANMSRKSNTEIQKVPHFILYVQGKPKARFVGTSKTIDSFRKFLSDALLTLQQQPTVQMVNAPPQTFVQNMYGGAPQNNTGYAPEMQNAPRGMNRMLQDGNPIANTAHPSMKQCDPEDKACLTMPEDVVPHNMPWESDIRVLNL
jgi:thiol-disulfide isomerase/thioredoxin